MTASTVSGSTPGAGAAGVGAEADRTSVVFVALFAAGVLLRFAFLARQSFWYDEVVSVLLAGAPLREIASGHVHDLGNPPLYPLLLHLWQRAFGSSDAAVRALSATASAASIPLVYAIAKRLLGNRVALVAMAIFSLSPVQVYFAQEARTYTLVTLLCLSSTALLLRAVEEPRRVGSWAGYALTVFLALYSHYFAAFVVVAQVVWILIVHRRRAVMVGLAGALATAGAVYAFVWLPSLIGQATTKGNLGRAVDTWSLHLLSTPLVFGVGTTLLWKGTLSPLRIAAAGVALVSFGGLALLGAWRLRRNRETLVLLVAWLGLPVLLPLIVSVALFPFYYVRYALVAAPAYYLLVAAGLCSLGRAGRLAAGGALAATCALSLGIYFTTLVKHDWRDAAAWVAARAEPGDIMAFDADIGETSFAHYAGANDTRVRFLEPPAGVPGARYWGTSPKKEPAHDVRDQLLSAHRVWFVFSDPQSGTGDYYRKLFQNEWSQTDGHDFRGVELRVLQPAPPARR